MDFIQRIKNRYQIIARSELQMFYHGTSSKYLKSILKHGMLPETKEGVWKEEDPHAAPESPSRKSYGGVYWSNNTLTSLRYGNDATRKFGGNPIAVMALLQLKTALPDEDDFHGIVTRSLNSVWGKDYRVTGSGKAIVSVLVSLYQNSNDAREIEKNFISTFIEYLGGDSKDTLAPKVVTSEFKKSLIDLLKASVIRRIAHEFQWENEYDRMLKDLLDQKETPPELKLKSISEGESLYRDALSIVLKHARRYVLHSHWNKTLRVTDPVGFSGRNRIVCIVEIIKDGDKYNLKLHYGKIPDEWLKEFKAQWSSNVEIMANWR